MNKTKTGWNLSIFGDLEGPYNSIYNDRLRAHFVVGWLVN